MPPCSFPPCSFRTTAFSHVSLAFSHSTHFFCGILPGWFSVFFRRQRIDQVIGNAVAEKIVQQKWIDSATTVADRKFENVTEDGHRISRGRTDAAGKFHPPRAAAAEDGPEVRNILLSPLSSLEISKRITDVELSQISTAVGRPIKISQQMVKPHSPFIRFI
jgi:hypothetical protein